MKIEFQKEDALIWVKAHEKEMVEDISALVRVPSVAQNGTEKELVLCQDLVQVKMRFSSS